MKSLPTSGKHTYLEGPSGDHTDLGLLTEYAIALEAERFAPARKWMDFKISGSARFNAWLKVNAKEKQFRKQWFKDGWFQVQTRFSVFLFSVGILANSVSDLKLM